MGIFVYPHTVQRLSETKIRNAANQMIPTWTAKDVVKCRYSPKSNKSHVGTFIQEPTQEHREIFVFLFPAGVNVQYGDRFKNVTGPDGVIIDDSTFQINSLVPITSWGGKLHHQVAEMFRIEAK